jgi:UDP:flavonoid glycosyltransferase YjiC (YdhE family)
MRLLAPVFGTHGDIHPLLGIACGMARRGHITSFIGHTIFGPLVRRLGFDFVDLNDEEEHRRLHSDPKHWSSKTGAINGAKFYFRCNLRPQYAAIAERFEPGKTMVLSSAAAFAGRIAQEKLGVPLATVHFSPFYCRSLVQPHVQPFFTIPRWWPKWFKKFFWWGADRWVIDPILAGDLNGFRVELGLRPARRFLNGWDQSPDLILGLFPEWFCAPRPPDWPAHLHLTDFPLFDEKQQAEEPLSPAIANFLAAGDPPVVFTPGTHVVYGKRFFEAAVAACQRLGRRGLLLTPSDQDVPAGLPSNMIHVKYVPFSRLLPRAAAMVTHGGVGTLAQGIAAGIPQLFVPLNFDQPDNAARCERLGLGRMLRPNRLSADNLTHLLRELLESSNIANNCREYSARIHAVPDPTRKACDLLEEYAQRKAVR